MTFFVTKWFQRKCYFKRKNINKNKKLQRLHICFPFHHSTFTRMVFKFCLRNQSSKKGPNFTLLQFKHVESGRENTTSYAYNQNLQVPADFFTFSK